ncbi:N-acetyltransferase [Adhaeribacter arboris]|uniref:N-acetyltransferase n=1 Tax=Adhaeribacter arboris TaxID=2072846 RepID=A0A2T2YMZ3_9BACT|nr:GNAT family N-acetyltransferase [Adhaeribacter arboris]PSR56856.1 N-acetyltransferase [Adhaeribacter arboris]
MTNISVKHNTEDQEFTVDINGQGGELAYSTPRENVIDFAHTYVDEELRNQGIANELIQAGLQYAQDNNFKVIASCPAVAAYVRRHAEWQKLLL